MNAERSPRTLGRRVALFVISALLMASTAPRLADVHITLMAKRHQAIDEINAIQAGVQGYYAKYGKYPFAADNASLMKLLTGVGPSGNERGTYFISFPASDFDAAGELLDPWNTPLQLSVTNDGKFHARSAGADTAFDTSDDFTNQ